MSQQQLPQRIFAGVGAATSWLASGLAAELGVAVEGGALAQVVQGNPSLEA